MGFGMQKSGSEQQHNTGLLGPQKAQLSAYVTPQVQSVGDFGISRLFSPLPTINAGRYGLDSAFDTAIDTLGSNMFSRTSANAAARGFVSPSNLSGVVGSAIREAAPQLAAYSDAAANRRLFGPEQIMSSRFGNVNNLFTAIAQLLGGSGSGSSSGFGFNFDSGLRFGGGPK